MTDPVSRAIIRLLLLPFEIIAVVLAALFWLFIIPWAIYVAPRLRARRPQSRLEYPHEQTPPPRVITQAERNELRRRWFANRPASRWPVDGPPPRARVGRRRAS